MKDYTRQEMELLFNIYMSTDRHDPYSPTRKDLSKFLGWDTAEVLAELVKAGKVREIKHVFKRNGYRLSGGEGAVNTLINHATYAHKGEWEPLDEKYAGIVQFEVEPVSNFKAQA